MSSLLRKRKLEDRVQNSWAKSPEGRLTLRPGHRYQICGGSREQTPEERLKRLNGEVDYVLERGFNGQELIPGINVDIVAETIWPLIRKDEVSNRLQELHSMLNMRLVSKFWLAFVDMSEPMHEQHMLLNRRGMDSFMAAPGRLGHLARQYSC